jgi:hypothetical protein
LGLAQATSFQVVVEVPATVNLATTQLVDADGNVVVSGDDDPIKTSGVLLGSGVNTISYPSRGADLPVVDGGYEQTLLIQSSSIPYDATIIAKRDLNASVGVLQVNLFLVGDEAQKESTRIVIDAALDLWRQIYAQIGVTLDVQIFDVSSDSGVLPVPFPGSDFYLNQATAPGVRAFSLNMYVGDTISADGTQVPGNELPVLGIASAIPGPAIPTRQSAVAISLAQHQGPDGQFSQEESDILGETMAHEGGHYLGLFHPVESNFAIQDPLEDTATCSSFQNCIDTGIGSNNMFPTPLPGVSQRDLTVNQGEVVNLQVLVQ